MSTELPDDIAQLKQMLIALQHDNQSLSSELQVLSTENSELRNQLEAALAQLNLSRTKQFGKRSEKLAKGTFNEAEQYQTQEKPRGKTGRKALPKHLTREVKLYTLDNPLCGCCGHTMHECGEQESEQMKEMVS